MARTKGATEAEISRCITQWEKDFLGRGSISVKTDILRDMIIVNLQAVLTPAEYAVCETKEGLLAVKKYRSELVESGIEELKSTLVSITGIGIRNFFTDLSSRTGERVMVFKMEEDVEKIWS